MRLSKKIKNWLIVLGTLCTGISFAQTGNPYWTLPPNYFPVPTFPVTALPTQTAPGYTGWQTNTDKQGEVVSGPHNMYMDPNGIPLFSFVSGFVFSPRGYLIDTLIDTLSVYRNSHTYTKVRQVCTGWGEGCVVPMPGSCSKYYIFTAVDYGSIKNTTYNSCFGSGSGTSHQIGYKPCFSIIDVSQQDPNGPNGEYGKNLSRTTAAKPTVVDLYTATSPTTSPADVGCPPSIGAVHYACTRLIAGSYRYLYVAVDDVIFVYKIDGTSGTNGMTYIQTVDFSSSSIFNDDNWDPLDNRVLSELEVYVDSANSKIKLAANMRNAVSGQYLVLADFSFSTGQYTSSSAKSKCFGGCDITEIITGIEFSPKGNYVYITRPKTTSDTCGVQAVLYSNTATIYKFSKAGVNTNDFGLSQMELGKDTVMYFIGQGGSNPRFAKITSPSAPNSTNFSDNIQTLTGYTSSSPYQAWTYSGSTSGAIPGGIQYQYNVLYLPDQIDKEYYGTPQFTSSSCCSIYAAYDKTNYTSTTAYNGSHNQVWKPGTNPFGNSSSPIYIENELRVASGYTVTIQNMTFKFTPQSTKETCIETNKTGSKTSTKFSSNSHWSYPFLIYTDAQDHFITHANENEMGFGKTKIPGLFNGQYEWKENFVRV